MKTLRIIGIIALALVAGAIHPVLGSMFEVLAPASVLFVLTEDLWLPR